MGNEKKTIGKYEIIKVIGKGSMGKVYKALDPEIGREVAIKIILESDIAGEDSRDLKRFKREAKSAEIVNHNVITVYEIRTK